MVNTSRVKIRSKKLGVLIRDARLASEKDIQTCAEALGVTEDKFSAYEFGEDSPSLPEIEALAYFLEVPIQHFWGQEAMSGESGSANGRRPLERIIALRHRIIGTLLRKERIDARLSISGLGEKTGIEPQQLVQYELAEQPVPLPELEILASVLGRSINEFSDSKTKVGSWMVEQQSTQQFLDLPLELQEFVGKPINRPYLEIAHRLSEMPVDRLRAVAEGLLEITL